MCILLPMLFLYWRKCHFSSYSYIRCLIKDPAERLKIHAYLENSQTGSRGPFDSPESWVHHDICSAILGPLLGAIWKQRNWPGQQGGPRKGKINRRLMEKSILNFQFDYLIFSLSLGTWLCIWLFESSNLRVGSRLNDGWRVSEWATIVSWWPHQPYYCLSRPH